MTYLFGLPRRSTARVESNLSLTGRFAAGLSTTHVCIQESSP
jgi:hypothetical protein